MSGTSGGPDWAKKEILDRIANASESSATSLIRMSGSSAKGFDRLARSAEQAAEETDRSTKKAKSLRNAITDLYSTIGGADRYERQSRSRSARELGASLSDSGAMFRRASDSVTNSISSIAVIGPIVGAGLGTISGFISSLMSTKDTFINMVDSGIMFSGSLSQFRIDVGNAGLTAEQFGAIAEKSGQAIRMFSEGRFLDSTLRLRSTFDSLGLSITQGNEYFAEYLENSRLSGSMYFKSQQEHMQGFEENLKQMREQAQLTGVSVRQQRDQQRALRQALEYQLLVRSVTPERRAYIESQEAALTPVAGADFAKEFLTMVERGIMVPGGFMATVQTFGGGQELLQLAERARRGEQLDPAAFQAAIAAIPASTFATALNMIRGSRPEMPQRLMDVRLAAEARVPGAARPGGLAPETIALQAAQSALTTVMTQVNSAMTSLGASILNYALPYLRNFSTVVNELTSATNLTTESTEEFRARILQQGLPEGLVNVLSSFRTGGFSAAAMTALGESASWIGGKIWEGMKTGWEEVTKYFTEWKESLIARLTAWSASLLEGFRNLPIVRWFGTSREGPVPEPQPSGPRQALSTPGRINPNLLNMAYASELGRRGVATGAPSTTALSNTIDQILTTRNAAIAPQTPAATPQPPATAAQVPPTATQTPVVGSENLPSELTGVISQALAEGNAENRILINRMIDAINRNTTVVSSAIVNY